MFLANQVVRVNISRPSSYASALLRLEFFDDNAPFLELHFIVLILMHDVTHVD